MSDRVSNDRLPTLEQRMDDVRAVLDAVGSSEAACSAYPRAAACACSSPRRIPSARGARPRRRLREAHSAAATIRGRRRWRSGSATLEEVERDWGGGPATSTRLRAAARATERCSSGIATYLRREREPRRRRRAPAHEHRRSTSRHVLPTDPGADARPPPHRRPGRRTSRGPLASRRRSRMRGFVELPGDEHLLSAATRTALLDEIEEFLTGARRRPDPDRVLATVLFTDIVGSTERARGARRPRAGATCSTSTHALSGASSSASAAARWTRPATASSRPSTGPRARDPVRACAIREGVQALGLEVRAGAAHRRVRADAATRSRGIAVHIGARVAAAAGPGEVLVSSTVKDLVAGLRDRVRGPRRARAQGRPGSWRLYSVVDACVSDALIIDAVRVADRQEERLARVDSRRRARGAGAERSGRAPRPRSRPRSRTSSSAASPRSASRAGTSAGWCRSSPAGRRRSAGRPSTASAARRCRRTSTRRPRSRSGQLDLVVSAGVEMMSRVPMGSNGGDPLGQAARALADRAAGNLGRGARRRSGASRARSSTRSRSSRTAARSRRSTRGASRTRSSRSRSRTRTSGIVFARRRDAAARHVGSRRSPR